MHKLKNQIEPKSLPNPFRENTQKVTHGGIQEALVFGELIFLFNSLFQIVKICLSLVATYLIFAKILTAGLI